MEVGPHVEEEKKKEEEEAGKEDAKGKRKEGKKGSGQLTYV